MALLLRIFLNFAKAPGPSGIAGFGKNAEFQLEPEMDSGTALTYTVHSVLMKNVPLYFLLYNSRVSPLILFIIFVPLEAAMNTLKTTYNLLI